MCLGDWQINVASDSRCCIQQWTITMQRLARSMSNASRRNERGENFVRDVLRLLHNVIQTKKLCQKFRGMPTCRVRTMKFDISSSLEIQAQINGVSQRTNLRNHHMSWPRRLGRVENQEPVPFVSRMFSQSLDVYSICMSLPFPTKKSTNVLSSTASESSSIFSGQVIAPSFEEVVV
jgi:hypothetical protein